jgi:hypothetical protein
MPLAAVGGGGGGGWRRRRWAAAVGFVGFCFLLSVSVLPIRNPPSSISGFDVLCSISISKGQFFDFSAFF